MRKGVGLATTAVKKSPQMLPGYSVRGPLGTQVIEPADVFHTLVARLSASLTSPRVREYYLAWVSHSTGIANQPALRRLPVSATSGADVKKPPKWVCIRNGNASQPGCALQLAQIAVDYPCFFNPVKHVFKACLASDKTASNAHSLQPTS